MPNRVDHRIHSAASPEDNGDESVVAQPRPETDREMKANMMLGLRGWLAQWAQFGAVGVLMGVFTIGAYYWRQDINSARQDDRDDRARERLDDRERLKERDDRLRDRDEVQNRILQSLSTAIDNQATATRDLKTEIRDMKVETRATTSAMEELTKTIKEKKQ